MEAVPESIPCTPMTHIEIRIAITPGTDSLTPKNDRRDLIGEQEHDRTEGNAKVEDRRHGTTPRLEDTIRDHTCEDAAHNPCDAEPHAPVIINEVTFELEHLVGLLGEGSVPLHRRLTDKATAKLDQRNRDDDRIGQHLLEDLNRAQLRTVVTGRCVGGVKVFETSVFRQFRTRK